MGKQIAQRLGVMLVILLVIVASGGAQTPQIAPPGADRIVFVSDREGSLQIYIMSADGANVARLTNVAGSNVSPVFSPDGRKIAFSSDRDGDPSQIYVTDADGANVARLTSPPGGSVSPAFSPDGSRIAFASNRDAPSDRENGVQIYAMNAGGSNVIRLTSPPGESRDPVFTPDGSQIMFASNRGGKFQIYAMKADGSNVTPLATATQEIDSFALSPNGRKIAFTAKYEGKYQVFLMDADGSHITRLSSPPGASGFPAFNRDGTKIAFSSDRAGPLQLYVMGIDGSNVTRLTPNSPGGDSNPVFGPPGFLPPPSTPLLHPASLCTVDPTIIPGGGMSRLKLGMPLTEVTEFLAAPSDPAKKDTSGDSTWQGLWYWSSHSDLEITAQDNSIVDIIIGVGTSDNTKCVTREGIHVGSLAASVKAAYGEPQGISSLPDKNVAWWAYNNLGFSVIVTMDGQVVLAMSVFPPGTFCRLQEPLVRLHLGGWPPPPACTRFKPPLSGVVLRDTAADRVPCGAHRS